MTLAARAERLGQCPDFPADDCLAEMSFEQVTLTSAIFDLF